MTTSQASFSPHEGRPFTLCIQWPRFGPYHMARLTATHNHAAKHNGRLVALETARTDTTYAWEIEKQETPFERVVVFDDAPYESLPAKRIHQSITNTLDQINPNAVAISSYSTPDARACLMWCKKKPPHCCYDDSNKGGRCAPHHLARKNKINTGEYV